jgi:hypothetical protein
MSKLIIKKKYIGGAMIATIVLVPMIEYAHENKVIKVKEYDIHEKQYENWDTNLHLQIPVSVASAAAIIAINYQNR